MTGVLVVDVGATDLRAGGVGANGTIGVVERAALAASSPAPGLSEFDLSQMAAATVGVAQAALVRGGPFGTVGIACPRAADTSGRPVEVAAVAEATTLGAGFLAGVAVGVWGDLFETTATVCPQTVVVPQQELDRALWARARQPGLRTIPELSELDF